MAFAFQYAPQTGDLIARIGPVAGEDALYDALMGPLHLPGYFGRNLDALYDCLRDLSRLKCARLVLIHDALPAMGIDRLRSYLEVLLDAMEEADSPRFQVILPAETRRLIAALEPNKVDTP